MGNTLSMQAAAEEIAWKKLSKANRAIPVPFNLKLKDSDDILCCMEVVRVIPGKRLVAFGTWGEKPVVAKLFYDRRSAARKAQRDLQGVEALSTNGVPTPKLYYKGSAQNRIHILLFERIWDAESLDALWQDKIDTEDRTSLMHSVTIELATQHVLGITQKDLHLKNFLVTEKQIYTLDGGDIDKVDYPLLRSESLENLGLFFSQLGVGTDALQSALFQTYTKSRGWLVKKQDILKLQNSINHWSTQRWQDYSKKILRSCTAFAKTHSTTAHIMYDRQFESADLLHFLKNPESVFNHPAAQVLKAGRSCTVAKVIFNNRSFVVKRYNIKDTWHRLRRCLRESRAVASWRLAQYLRWVGIPTARPVAFIENCFFGFRGKSYFVMEHVQGDDVGRYFAAHPDALPVAERVVMLFENLARLRIAHGDLKMTNILIEKERPVLIDLDGMRKHESRLSFRRALRKEMVRFMENWRDRPTVAAIFDQLIQKMYKRLKIN